MTVMKKFLIAASISLITVMPAAADDSDRGLSLMEEGARLFLEGIMREMEPAIDELEKFADDIEPKLKGFAEQMGPALRNLISEIEDWSVYHPPEILPNGDIVIRKKTPAEIAEDPQSDIET